MLIGEVDAHLMFRSGTAGDRRVPMFVQLETWHVCARRWGLVHVSVGVEGIRRRGRNGDTPLRWPRCVVVCHSVILSVTRATVLTYPADGTTTMRPLLCYCIQKTHPTGTVKKPTMWRLTCLFISTAVSLIVTRRRVEANVWYRIALLSVCGAKLCSHYLRSMLVFTDDVNRTLVPHSTTLAGREGGRRQGGDQGPNAQTLS